MAATNDSTSVEENGENCEDLIEEECVEEAKEENVVLKNIKDQIFQSPLPPYTPLISCDDAFSADKYFTCAECDDKFIVESSLKFHMERRSVLITYDCAECGTIITMFNRCSLLAHFRVHSTDGKYVCDPTRIKVIPIPFDKMLLGPLNFGNKTDSSDPNSSNEESPNDLNCALSIRCFECNEQVMQSLCEHFLGRNTPIDCDLQCNECNLILPTKCSFKAHSRYHKGEQPFVCPECTELYLDWNTFYQHVSNDCYHIEKCVRYKCPCCELVVTSYISLQAHFCEKHVKIVFKCNGCPIACFTKQALQSHIDNFHAKGSFHPFKSYRQCQLCPEILLQESLLLAHVLEHVKKPAQRVYGYQCNSCNSTFEEKKHFKEHKSKCLKNQKTPQAIVEIKSKPVSSPTNCKVIEAKNKEPVPSSWINLSDIQNSKMKNNVPSNKVTSFFRIPVAQFKSKNANLKTTKVVNTASTSVNNQKPVSTNGPLAVISKSSLSQYNSLLVLPSAGGKVVNSGVKTFLVEKNINNQANSAKLSPFVTVGNKKQFNGQEVKKLLNGVDKPAGAVNRKKVTRIISQCVACRKELVFNIPSGDKSNMNVSLRCLTCTRKISENNELTNKDIVGLDILKSGIVEKKGQKLSAIGSKQLGEKKNATTGSEPLKKKLKVSSETSEKKEKFRCHVCQSVLPLDWDLIRNHYSTKHKDLNIVVVAPKPKNSESNSESPGSKDSQVKKSTNKNSSSVTQEIVSPKVKKVRTNSETQTNSTKIVSLPGNSCPKEKKLMKSSEVLSKVRKSDKTLQENGLKEPKSDINTGSSKSKSRKKMHRKEKKSSFSPLISGQVVSSVNQRNTDGKFTCSICKFLCADVTLFRSHITTHNSDRSAYQCLECGMCFVVRPSFEKHLIIYHCIKNVESYIQENELCQLKSPEKAISENVDDAKENECCVCHQQFDNPVELRKHFRTHGMAFLSLNKRELKSV